jgi:hypothetical protein
VRLAMRGPQAALPQMELAVIRNRGHLHSLTEPAAFTRLGRPSGRWRSRASDLQGAAQLSVAAHREEPSW